MTTRIHQSKRIILLATRLGEGWTQSPSFANGNPT